MMTAPVDARSDPGDELAPAVFAVRFRTTEFGPEISVSGEVDAFTAPVLASSISAGCELGPVALDLEGVTFCSAAGVSALVRSLGDHRARSFTASAIVDRLLELCGIAVSTFSDHIIPPTMPTGTRGPNGMGHVAAGAT